MEHIEVDLKKPAAPAADNLPVLGGVNARFYISDFYGNMVGPFRITSTKLDTSLSFGGVKNILTIEAMLTHD